MTFFKKNVEKHILGPGARDKVAYVRPTKNLHGLDCTELTANKESSKQKIDQLDAEFHSHLVSVAESFTQFTKASSSSNQMLLEQKVILNVAILFHPLICSQKQQFRKILINFRPDPRYGPEYYTIGLCTFISTRVRSNKQNELCNVITCDDVSDSRPIALYRMVHKK